MVDLTSTEALAGHAPLKMGGVTLEATTVAPLTLVMPFSGQSAAVSAALEADIGMGLPQIGRSEARGDARVTWFGKGQWLVSGTPVRADLPAARTDQSDGWVAVSLEGAGARDVLARLTPIDLRDSAFGNGATARTELGHMHVSITRTGETRYVILAFRSMAQTLWHDLAEAVRGVAARHSG